MSKIEELIKTFCPNGVEYKDLGNIATYVRGVTYNKKQEINDSRIKGVKLLRANNITLETMALNFNEVKLISEKVKIKDEQYLKKDDILICAGSGSRQHIGKVAYIDSDMDYTFGGFMAVIRCEKSLLPRYLFHLLTGTLFEDYLNRALNSATINNLNASIMSNFSIPFPPVEVQEEIVRILDKFTAMSEKLNAELELRKKQYEYYREKLLISSEKEIENKKFKDIGSFFGGLSGKSKADFIDGNAKFITYMNVYSNPSINLKIEDMVRIDEGEKQNTIAYGDVLFTTSSETPDECGMSSVVTEYPKEKFYLNSFCFGFRMNDLSLYNVDFLKHLFRSKSMRKAICRCASGVTRFNVSKKKLEEITIPFPPVEVQEEIVRILDKFTALIEKLNQEITFVQKQYEYYRDKLLTF